MNESEKMIKTTKSNNRVILIGSAIAMSIVLMTSSSAHSATTIDLGDADSFAILAGSTITNTGTTTVLGDIGLHPGTVFTGSGPGADSVTVTGTVHLTDAIALNAKNSLTTAYSAAAAAPSDATVTADLGGQTLLPGVYTSASSLGLTGNLTLDGAGDPNAVFIFQAGSTLTTASASSITLIGEATACNVFWQVGSSATLGTSSTFVGTVMALASITAQTSATIEGRLLASTAAVTLDTNTITKPVCEVTPTETPTDTPSPTDTPTPTPTDELADTGSNGLPLGVIAGFTAAILGGSVLVVSRRRRATK